jgi:hypothetical protein
VVFTRKVLNPAPTRLSKAAFSGKASAKLRSFSLPSQVFFEKNFSFLFFPPNPLVDLQSDYSRLLHPKALRFSQYVNKPLKTFGCSLFLKAALSIFPS